VKGCAGEITFLCDSEAERSPDLTLEGAELGVAEETELEGEVLTNEEASGDLDFAGLG
jgi:hypothetical protein